MHVTTGEERKRGEGSERERERIMVHVHMFVCVHVCNSVCMCNTCGCVFERPAILSDLIIYTIHQCTGHTCPPLQLLGERLWSCQSALTGLCESFSSAFQASPSLPCTH